MQETIYHVRTEMRQSLGIHPLRFGHTKYRKVPLATASMHNNVPQGMHKVPQGRFKIGKRFTIKTISFHFDINQHKLFCTRFLPPPLGTSDPPLHPHTPPPPHLPLHNTWKLYTFFWYMPVSLDNNFHKTIPVLNLKIQNSCTYLSFSWFWQFDSFVPTFTSFFFTCNTFDTSCKGQNTKGWWYFLLFLWLFKACITGRGMCNELWCICLFTYANWLLTK